MHQRYSCCGSLLDVERESQNLSLRSIQTRRDVLIVPLVGDNLLTVTCDSSGGVGPKPYDRIHVDGRTLGKFTARVALMETLAIGAHAKCMSVTLPLERGKFGLDILSGIRAEVSLLAYDVPIIDSTENNFKVRQSGAGVTVIGIVNRASIRLGYSRRDDVVLSIGLPSVGREVLLAEKRGHVADLNDVLELARLPYVHDVIPVGSRGIHHETAILAKDSHLRFVGSQKSTIKLEKSAGPATVVLCSVAAENVPAVTRVIEKPVNVIGVLR